VVQVSPLEPPPLGRPEAVAENAAVQLFCDRLDSNRVRSSVRRSDPPENVEPVARICRAVEGVPLALVLAAARANELGTITLADVLERTLGEGKGLTILSGAGHIDSTPETLDETMEWSYRLLDDGQRDLFDRLSVFRAGFGLEDAVVVCGGPNLSQEDVVAGLERLVRASLVNADNANEGLGRFRLLQPVRDFASSKLVARHGRAAAVRRRHAHHFLTLAQAAEPHLRGPQDRATLDRLDASLPDLYAAIRWAIDEKEGGIALRLVGCLWVFWLVRGRIAEGRQMLEAALALDSSPSGERIKALIACAQLAWFGGDLNRTRECNREVLAVSEATGDAWGWAWSALGFTALEMFGSEDDGVPIRIEEILPLFWALGNDWDTGMALQTLGGAAWHRGQYERAEKAQSETADIFRSLGHPTLMSSLRVHGLMLALLGDLDAGEAEVDTSIVRSYEAGDLAGLAEALCCRGSIARYGGNHDLARHYYRDALRMACDAGEVWKIQWALDGLGSTDELGLRVAPERLAASVRLLARAEAMARETGIILAPRERAFHARDLERARARLDEEAFTEALARGEKLSLDEAIDLALSLDETAVSAG
jgi:predicted ATPase